MVFIDSSYAFGKTIVGKTMVVRPNWSGHYKGVMHIFKKYSLQIAQIMLNLAESALFALPHCGSAAVPGGIS
jgi:hypothetical protein